MSLFDDQLSLFSSSSLSGAADLFWGELEGEESPLPSPISETPLVIPQTDFRLNGTRGLATAWKDRAGDNIAAIRLLGTLETEDRNATPDEQAVLSRFIGFGAGELANALFPRAGEPFRAGWESIGKALVAACNETDHAALARSTQYAHYTPEYIVTALWDMLMKRGFQGGSVLEPGCGVGQFIALRPERLEGQIAFTGIEVDGIAARIARKLFPKQWIRHEDFTKATLATTYDLAIGNPPFSNRLVNAVDHRELRGFSLHDWFIARSVGALRPGGFAAFVTSRHTLDKTDQKARQHIAEEADLLGAVRLPAGAMRADAGTEVVLDLLVFRKRMIGEMPGDQTWLETAPVPDSDEGRGPLRINRYFLNNPAQVLGQHGWASSQFGLDYCCLPVSGVDLQTALPEALARIAPESRFLPPVEQRITRPELDGLRVGTAASGADLKEGSYYLHNRILHQIIGGTGQEVPIRKGDQKEGLFQKHARIIEALIPVRDAAKAVLRAQMDNQPFGRHQHRLRQTWQSFTRQFGPINLTNTTVRVNPTTGEETESRRRPNLQPFYDDPDVWLVSSIEEYDEATQTARPGPLFTERVIHAPVEPEIHSAHDALAVCLHDVGHVDLPLIAELTGCSVDDALNELGEAVYLDPEASCEGRDVWVAADELLSGAVRTKLAAAREAAHSDPRFARTAAVLERAQPEDLRPSDITARLGAPWLPVSDIMAFTREVLGVEAVIRHTTEVACWSVEKRAFFGRAEATSVWGTERRHAGELLEDALTQASPKIWDTVKDANGNDSRVLNTQETEAAKEKLSAIRQAFQNWVWQDAERADRLVRLYNDTYNNLVPRTFDGTHLRLPGASTVISLREHQKRVIWRIIAAGSTYIAHAVGSGKTFSMCAAVMEQKRLGLISKAMIVVPGHCLAHYLASSFIWGVLRYIAFWLEFLACWAPDKSHNHDAELKCLRGRRCRYLCAPSPL